MNVITEIAFLGKLVKVIIDRPIKSRHPKFGYVYELNYGFIPNTLANDGMEVDAYVIGEENPLKEFEGIVKAIIIRENDVENKLIVTHPDYGLTITEVKQKTFFQEQFFDIKIRFLKS